MTEDYEDFEQDEYFDEYEDEGDYDSGYQPVTADAWLAANPGKDPRMHEADFDDYDEYQDARVKYRVAQELRGASAVNQAVQPGIDDPRERDDFYLEKTEIINNIQKYRDDEQKALDRLDYKKAQHCRQMADSFEKDFAKLETEHPDPTYTQLYKEGLEGYRADLENAIENIDDFEQRRKAAQSDTQFYRDVQQRVKTVNKATDDGTLYFVNGDSKHGRLPTYHVAKIELPVEQKQKILNESTYRGTIYDLLVSYGFIEKMEAPESVKKEDPNEMDQETYEAWRQKNDPRAKPTYIPI
jgi:hypothetical protein